MSAGLIWEVPFREDSFLPLPLEPKSSVVEGIVKTRMHFAGNPIWDELVPDFWMEHFMAMTCNQMLGYCLELGIEHHGKYTKSMLAAKLTQYFINLTTGKQR